MIPRGVEVYVKDQRGFLRSALGYCVRQRAALCRFLEDGRLKLDNNASERELKRIATGRKAWLFVGSDDHAHAAAALFSLIATCKLHGIEPGAVPCATCCASSLTGHASATSSCARIGGSRRGRASTPGSSQLSSAR